MNDASMDEAPAKSAFDNHRRILDQWSSEGIAKAALLSRIVAKSLSKGGKVLVCGNGGSAADAQHFAAELVGRFEMDRAALPAISLTTDTSSLTAIANDFGYEHVFARQVDALAREGDVLFAISTSGSSRNVLLAVDAAKARGCMVIGFTGMAGAEFSALCDQAVVVPSENAARIQEFHILMLHSICSCIEQSLIAE